eukprot:m.354083 g.354083  ORF g.354083 m.354083 type:complete len:962 (-) comp16916_c0_seq1:372-3257(-)
MADARLIRSRGVGETENLTELENLNEESLLQELKARYDRDLIYTYVGEILVAINPFKSIPGIYDDSKRKLYTNMGDRSAEPPHIFAMADAAFQAMVGTPPGPSANQVCVISGESGAGKTESAKLFMKHVIYLSTLSGQNDTAHGLEDKIIQLNPLLEAWGNAQTLMNDNSSRFGKFVQLRFNAQHHIEGAIMSDYLLEKSRVVRQGEGERNFHVFYLFFAGLDAATREQFEVSDPEEHRFINGNDEALAEIDGLKDMYAELAECIEIVGFSAQEINNLWSLISGVLHTGDIEFGGDEEAYIVSTDDIIAKATNQLGVVRDAMTEALTTSVNMTRGEAIVRKYKPFEAEDARDAMAKALYGKAFRWIVQSVNKLLGPKSIKPRASDKNIGILDIFGFECFDDNSFEQLLINLANERLQQFFNDHIFKMELDEYAKEGIDGSTITYEDNSGLLDMFMSRPAGLLSLCDEEALFPNGSDRSMVDKFHQNLHGKQGYEKPRGNDLLFTINHYAGRVTYQAANFLDKNRDTLPIDVTAALRLSDNDLVREIFQGDEEDKAAAKKGKGRRDAAGAKANLRKSMKKAQKQAARAKKTTVGADFKDSLIKLMAEMSNAAPHFIRCIKPNHVKQPAVYEEEMVTKQLRYTGMLETTRIRKEGYAFRPTFKDFLHRYKILAFPYTSSPPASGASCSRVLEKAGLTGWQIGKTKVFLRYFHMDELNEKFLPFPMAARTFTSIGRGFLARAKTKKLLAEAEMQAKQAQQLFAKVESYGSDMSSVVLALCDEDAARPADFWTKPAPKPADFQDPKMKKLAKKAQGKQGFTRAASVKWFKEVEMKKGAGISSAGKFEEWFHGVITRKDSEALLRGKEPGTFLVRVSESRFGYSLSHCVVAGGRIKHYMIDQTPDQQYQVVGNRKLFPSLNELVSYHHTHKIVSDDPVCLIYPCGQQGDEDDRLELVDKKTRGMLS